MRLSGRPISRARPLRRRTAAQLRDLEASLFSHDANFHGAMFQLARRLGPFVVAGQLVRARWDWSPRRPALAQRGSGLIVRPAGRAPRILRLGRRLLWDALRLASVTSSR
jgi:hypothetical protein